MKRSFDTIEEIQGRYEAICEFYFSIFKYTKPIDGVHSEKNGLLKRLLYSVNPCIAIGWLLVLKMMIKVKTRVEIEIGGSHVLE